MYTMYTKYSYTNTITLRSFIYLLGNRLRQKKSLIFCSRYFSLLYDLGIASICIFVCNMQRNALMYYNFTVLKLMFYSFGVFFVFIVVSFIHYSISMNIKRYDKNGLLPSSECIWYISWNTLFQTFRNIFSSYIYYPKPSDVIICNKKRNLLM